MDLAKINIVTFVSATTDTSKINPQQWAPATMNSITKNSATIDSAKMGPANHGHRNDGSRNNRPQKKCRRYN